MPVLKNPFSDVADPKPNIETTRQMAAYFHRKQEEISGVPYINHPVRVAQNLQKLKTIVPDGLIDDRVIMAALMHDVMEDCYIDEAETRKVNEDDLRSWGYDDETIAMVKGVTNEDSASFVYEEKIQKLIDSGNIGAMLVKLADNMDNTHPLRAASYAKINPEKGERLQARYKASITALSSALGINADDVFDLVENHYQDLNNNATQPISP